MIKVCHINLAKGFRGGERQTELLIHALCKYDSFFQKVIIRKDSPLVDRLATTKGRFELITVSKPYIKHARRIKDCDLIHVHEAKAGQFAYLATRIYKRPYLITRRVPNPIKANFLSSRIYSKSKRIVALSRAISDVLVDYNSDLRPIIIPSMVSNLSVHLETKEKIRSRYKGKFLVGHAGALVNHHKGQQYIIEAARQLREELPQLHFLLLGEGRDEAILKRMAQGLTNLEFLGFHENLGDFLAAFDLFVFPSLHEGLGSILLDAMQFKLPIVASNVHGIPDVIVHEKTGLLIAPGDGQALADSIKYLYQNRKICQELSDNAYKNSQSYQPQAIAARYLQVYHDIMDECVG